MMMVMMKLVSVNCVLWCIDTWYDVEMRCQLVGGIANEWKCHILGKTCYEYYCYGR